jgi:hypothetical protein
MEVLMLTKYPNFLKITTGSKDDPEKYCQRVKYSFILGSLNIILAVKTEKAK